MSVFHLAADHGTGARVDFQFDQGTALAQQLELVDPAPVLAAPSLRRILAAAPDRRRIVAMHHPVEGPPGEPRSLAGATEAATAFAAMGVEIVLSGHLHFSYAAPLSLAPGVLSVQAGTCVSTRTRSDGNAFTMLDLGDSAVTLTHIRAQPDKSFRADAEWTLRQEGGRWAAPGL